MDDKKLRARIANILHDIGVKANVSGYGYIIDGVILMLQRQNYSMVRGIYNEIGCMHDKTYASVERNIRSAIESAFKRCPVDTLEKYFKNCISWDSGKITNGEFLAIVTEWITLDKDLV